MGLRNYNKLFVNTDREEGSEKITLGYRNDIRESIIYPDKETYFHIPFYTKSLLLNDSSLIASGATGGPFPAASDRIFKSLRGYGNVTANGTPSELADGGWFCSWLYKNADGEMMWMDRFYNPGQFILNIATLQLEEGPPYISHNPVFRDVPSQIKFESGVLYKYFHVGEKTAQELVSTFTGLSGERTPLNLENWGTSSPDSSSYGHTVRIFTDASETELYGKMTESLEHIYAPTINFDNNKSIEVQIDWDPSYNLTTEFTLAFWAQSNNWKSCPSTQLVGNYTSTGGLGIFIDTLSSYPYFVIPETGYGHLLYVNENLNPFLDTNVQINTLLTATPKLVGMDSEDNVILCFNDDSRTITKYDNAGHILNKAVIPLSGGPLVQLLCGPNDNYIVISATKRYTFDVDLNLISTTSWNALSSVAAYAYNPVNNFLELVSYDNVLDSKFIETTSFILSTDGHLYKRLPTNTTYTKLAHFKDKGHIFAIDPYDRIWVLHGNNNVSVFDSYSNNLTSPLFSFDVGPNISYVNKNLTFMCVYDRKTDTREWRCVIYQSSADEFTSPQLYFYDLTGSFVKVLDILSFLNLNLMNILKQKQSSLNFSSIGDFTGYERKRVFNKLAPYNNTPQLILKTSLKDRNKSTLAFNRLFKSYISIKDWDNKSWNHIALTLENRTFKMFVNSIEKARLSYSGQYDLTFETQPTMFIGSPVGAKYGFNKEIASTSAIFNGRFESIRFYDYAMNSNNLELFLRASIKAQNIFWNLPTPSLQYMERIERMFKNKIPGAKSSFFNLKLRGSGISDEQTKAIIEEEIREVVRRIKPIYAEFLKITWID